MTADRWAEYAERVEHAKKLLAIYDERERNHIDIERFRDLFVAAAALLDELARLRALSDPPTDATRAPVLPETQPQVGGGSLSDHAAIGWVLDKAHERRINVDERNLARREVAALRAERDELRDELDRYGEALQHIIDIEPARAGTRAAEIASNALKKRVRLVLLREMRAERDAAETRAAEAEERAERLARDMRAAHSWLPHTRGCDEPDDPECPRCLLDAALAEDAEMMA